MLSVCCGVGVPWRSLSGDEEEVGWLVVGVSIDASPYFSPKARCLSQSFLLFCHSRGWSTTGSLSRRST